MYESKFDNLNRNPTGNKVKKNLNDNFQRDKYLD